jgi:general secretion pathway protein L
MASMDLVRQGLDGVSRWIGTVAAVLLALRARITPMRSVELIEDAAGVLTLQSQPDPSSAGDEPRSLQIADGKIQGATPELITALRGCHLAMLLQPTRFVFRALQFPRQAGEFLDDIVRAQIDRVTPWSAEAAVFGCGPPSDIGNDRIAVTVAATAREMLAPLLDAVSNLRPAAVAVFTCAEGDDPATGSIKVLEHQVRGARDVGGVRRLLSIILAVGVLAACTAAAAAFIVEGVLEAQQSVVTQRLAELRLAKQAGQIASKEEVALASLEARKHQIAPSVIVLESLSQLLPDHTYVTELRILGDKLQLIGVTRDAPSLIRLIEQSPRFTRATFFAPTTRAPSDPGEHFHIEARIEPVSTASQ